MKPRLENIILSILKVKKWVNPYTGEVRLLDESIKESSISDIIPWGNSGLSKRVVYIPFSEWNGKLKEKRASR